MTKKIDTSGGGGTGPIKSSSTAATNHVPYQATALDPDLAAKRLPGEFDPGKPGTPATTNYAPETDSQYLQALAKHFNLDPNAPDLEQQVTKALNHRYPAQEHPGLLQQAENAAANLGQGKLSTQRPGASKAPVVSPGAAGKGLEKGVDRVDEDAAAPLAGVLAPGATMGVSALTGKNPESPESFDDKKPGKGKRPVKGTSKANAAKAADRSLADIAAQLGADASKDPITAIAEKVIPKAELRGTPTTTPATPAGAQTPQTVGELWNNFNKQLASPDKQSQDWTKQQVAKLEAGGFLDKDSAQPGNWDKAAVADAYKSWLQTSVSSGRTLDQVISDHQTNTSSVAKQGGTSEAAAAVQQEADSLGVYLSPEMVTGLANWVESQPGSNQDQLRAAIIKQYDPNNPNNPPGLATSITTQIQSEANAYQIPLSTGALQNYTKNAMLGGATDATSAAEQAKLTFQQQAATLYPTLAPQILAGNDVKTLTDPYLQVAEQYTAVPAATMQLDDPSGKWSKFLQGGQDPKTGAPTMMGLDQWKKTLMQDPRYGFDKTQGGQDMGEQMSTAILGELGFITQGSSPNADISNTFSGNVGSANTH